MIAVAIRDFVVVSMRFLRRVGCWEEGQSQQHTLGYSVGNGPTHALSNLFGIIYHLKGFTPAQVDMLSDLQSASAWIPSF